MTAEKTPQTIPPIPLLSENRSATLEPTLLSRRRRGLRIIEDGHDQLTPKQNSRRVRQTVVIANGAQPAEPAVSTINPPSASTNRPRRERSPNRPPDINPEDLSDPTTLIPPPETEPELADLRAVEIEMQGMTLGLGNQPEFSNSQQFSPLDQYLQDIGGYPLLTREQEVELAKQIERGSLAAETLRQPGVDSDRALLDQYKQELEMGNHAKIRLAEHNLKWVIAIAKKYTGRGLSLLDLIQEGNIGLMRAVEKFDFRRGFKFSTCAYWWIRQAVTRAIHDQSRNIRVPVHLHQTMSTINKRRQQVAQELGREPEIPELAEALNMTPQRLSDILITTQDTISMETPLGGDESAALRLKDRMADPNINTSPDEIISARDRRERILAILAEVTDGVNSRAYRIMVLRFGLDENGQNRTLKEVGAECGVTRERIRQIEAKVLRQLRGSKYSLRLREFI